MISFAQTVAPTEEPVTLAEAKAHARIEYSADDTTVTTLITIARRKVEQITRRALVTQTWTATFDRWPLVDGAGDDWPFTTAVSPRRIRLAPAQVASIGSLVVDGTTIASSNYRLAGDELVIMPTVADSTRELGGGIVVTFTAGFGLAAAVPDDLKLACKMLVAHWFENREVANPAWQTPMPIPFGVEDLLRPYIAMREF